MPISQKELEDLSIFSDGRKYSVELFEELDGRLEEVYKLTEGLIDNFKKTRNYAASLE